MAIEKKQKITIVGCGPGAPEFMTGEGRKALEQAEVVVGAPHLLAAFASPRQEQVVVTASMEAVLAAIETQRAVAVLVSGDPGLCSLADPILRRFGKEACDVIPGISSVQLAFARLGLSWENARIVSAHKAIPNLTHRDLSTAPIIAVLAGHAEGQGWIATLAENLGESHSLVVCEDLSLATEAIRRVSISEFRRLSLSTRTIVLLLKEDLPS